MLAGLAGVLWDNDGVLVDTERLFYESNRELFAHHRIALSERQFFDWYLVDNCGAWHLLEARGITAAQIAALRDGRNRKYSERLAAEHIPAIAGVAELLAALAPRLRMGVVTSSHAEHFDIIHRRLSLLQHFEFVLTQECYVNSKPSPEPYLLGLERLGLAAAQCVVVEDSPRGLQAARAAGLRCIILRNALTRHYDFPGALRVVDDMAQLRAALEELM
ncbi:HAD family hydrolase [Rugamonas sp. CCM 8940]|uniref:HAD family hydrolase n=1 Tax=Rugamonas sp. CCM 8940 TaxID=2765359 RepID=UPI0018F75D44|nr:HAD family phosphatase [Rugamonas sp. CCM 8940]MBJ7310898.1 HAD family phosphatase [Rugamonas sp. CCM 8940]